MCIGYLVCTIIKITGIADAINILITVKLDSDFEMMPAVSLEICNFLMWSFGFFCAANLKYYSEMKKIFLYRGEKIVLSGYDCLITGVLET